MNELCFGAQPRAKPGPERGSHWWQWMVDLSCQRSAICSQWSCFCEGGIINSTYWLNIRWYGKAWTKLLANPIFFRWALGRKIEAFWDWILDKLGWEVCTKFAVGKMMIWTVNWKHKGWRPCLYLKKGWGQAALVPFLNLGGCVSLLSTVQARGTTSSWRMTNGEASECNSLHCLPVDDDSLVFPLFLSHVKSLQSRPTLCNPMNCSPAGSSVHGILQARILEWVAIPFSRGSSRPRDGSGVLHV